MTVSWLGLEGTETPLGNPWVGQPVSEMRMFFPGQAVWTLANDSERKAPAWSAVVRPSLKKGWQLTATTSSTPQREGSAMTLHQTSGMVTGPVKPAALRMPLAVSAAAKE